MLRTMMKAAFALVAGVMMQAAGAEAAWQCVGSKAVCAKAHAGLHKQSVKHASTKTHKTAHVTKKKTHAKVASSKPAKVAKKSKGGSGGSSYQSGVASWYGGKFHGRQTASGEIYNQNALTAAHRSLPFGTKVRVTNTATGNSVVVRINDRGPFVGGRVIDLSRAAASSLGIDGLGRVKIAVLGKG